MSDVVGRRPTIVEVARLAQVSHQTVSRYLRGDTGMKERTREQIAGAIAELGYRPNLMARAMRSRRTGRLGVLLPAGDAISSITVLAGAFSTAHAAGYQVEVTTLPGSPTVYGERALELAHSGLFEGILSLTPLDLASSPGIGAAPLVVAPHFDEQMRAIGELADATRIGELVEGLASLGHRRFLHLAGDYAHTSARNRRDVYLATLGRLGLESYAVVETGWSADVARRAVLDLPDDCGVTAVIGAGDVAATGAIRGAMERGRRVPHDLSVTGWDDNPVAAAMAPSLTTVAMDHERLGRRAMATLLAAVDGASPPAAGGPITEVIWRESTGPAPGREHQRRAASRW